MSLTHDLTALVDPDPEPIIGLVPAALGRYVIEAEIGQGAMGTVYRATDPVLDRRVALKVIRLPFAMSLEERGVAEQRFLREASLAASMTHPNSVIVHDFGRDGETGLPFIAFEYLKGRSLTDLIARGPRPDWREALAITARVACALHHAHERGVIHRDVKPGNVMVLESGEPKILDFGIARVSSAEITGVGDTWGTPSYMSPEQVTGEVLDPRSDLFSLGAVSYELLTGRVAFQGDSVPQIVSRIAFGEVVRPTSVAPGLPAAVDVLLARALAKDPAQRYRSGREFADDIADVLEGRALRERPGLATTSSVGWITLPARPVPQPAPRRRGVVGPLFAACVALGALVASIMNEAGTTSRTAPLTATASAPSFAPATPLAAWVATNTAPTRRVPARVALSVEHRFERGRLRVFVDEALALDRRLAGQPTRHLLVLKRRSGSLGEVLELAPGQRVLRFEIEGDGARHTGRLRSAFRSDQTRMLRLKAGKRLDLEWQT